MSPLLAITGATGNIGRRVVEILSEQEVRVRAIAHESPALRQQASLGVEIEPGALEDTAFLTRALRGADAVFAMIPQRFDVEDYVAHQRSLVDSMLAAIRASGVHSVVALSAVGAPLRTGLSGVLAELEEGLRSITALNVVVLRPMFYMDNFLAALDPIRSMGINGGVTRPDLAIPMIATRDVARTVADLLVSRSFRGFAIRELVGPRAYTNAEATAILGGAIGNPGLMYVQFPYDGMHAQLTASGFSRSSADAFVAMFTALNEGRIQDAMSPELASTAETTLEEFADDVFAPAYRSV
jgi:uncharacterized protein YbjT (DUF2867 family)